MGKKFNMEDEINSRVKENWLYYKKEIVNSFNDLKHRNTFYKQIPNLLTVSRVIGMIPVSILLVSGNIILGMLLLGLLMSTDFFDGRIARKYNLSSKFGADLDAVSDKIMGLGLMIPLIFDCYLLIINILLEGLISFVNVKGRIKGIDTKTVFTGKVKTCFLSLTLFLGYLTKFIGFYYNFFAILTILTSLVQLKTYHDYTKIISSDRNIMVNRKLDNDSSFLEEVKKEDRLDELRRERKNLISLDNSCEKKRVKVRKRKK